MNGTAVVSIQAALGAFNYDDPALFRVLKETLYPGAQDASVSMVLDYCRATRLDPMTKPVHLVPMWDSKQRCMKDTVMPGIGLYRIQASRTGEYVGISEPEFGQEITRTFTGTTEYEDRNGKKVSKSVEATVTYPNWCKITVYRLIGGMPRAFTALEFWDENYATQGKTDVPNSMWQKRRFGQLVKCAEAQALRKAFPELGSAPTAEEMEGKLSEGVVINQDGEIISGTGQEGHKAPGPGTVTDLQGRINERKAAQQSTASAPPKQPSPPPSPTPTPTPATPSTTGTKGAEPSGDSTINVNTLVTEIANAGSEVDLEKVGKKAEKLQSEEDKKKVRMAYRIRLNELRKPADGGNAPMFT